MFCMCVVSSYYIRFLLLFFFSYFFFCFPHLRECILDFVLTTFVLNYKYE